MFWNSNENGSDFQGHFDGISPFLTLAPSKMAFILNKKNKFKKKGRKREKERDGAFLHVEYIESN